MQDQGYQGRLLLSDTSEPDPCMGGQITETSESYFTPRVSVLLFSDAFQRITKTSLGKNSIL